MVGSIPLRPSFRERSMSVRKILFVLLAIGALASVSLSVQPTMVNAGDGGGGNGGNDGK
jgi:hypothetical protein